MKKRTKIMLICLLVITGGIIWYLIGYPGGWIPGKYDSKGYRLWYVSKPFQGSTDGVIFIRFFNPLGKGSPYQVRYYGDSVASIWYRNKGQRIGAIDSKGKMILPAIYDFAQPLRGMRLRRLEKDSLFGIFDCKTQKIILPVQYKHIEFPWSNNKKTFIIRDENRKTGLADSTGKILIPCKYQSYYSNFYYIAFHNSKDTMGRFFPEVYDYQGRLVVGSQYEYVWLTDHTIPFFIARNNNKQGYFIDKQTGQTQQVDFIVTHTNVFSDSLVIMKAVYTDSIQEEISWKRNHSSISNAEIKSSERNYKALYGLTTLNGKVLLPFTNDTITTYLQDMLIITKEKSMGLMNKDGQWIIPLKPQKIQVLKNIPLVEVRSNPLSKREWCYFTDLNGTIILSGKAQVIRISLKHEKYGYIWFHLNGKMYELTFDKEKKCFEWRRHN